MVQKMDAGVMKKVLLITNIPNPYRVPLFNALSKKLREQNILLKVVFSTWTYDRRKFTLDPSELHFDYEVLGNKVSTSAADQENTRFYYKGLSKLISTDKPDCVIVSGFSHATVTLWLRNFRENIPYIIWTGSVLRKGRKDSWLRMLQRRIISRAASAFIVYGNDAAEYLKAMNIESSKIFRAVNTVDTTYFASETERIRNNIQPDNKRFLCLGYLVLRKNITAVLKAVKTLSTQRSDFHLDIVGDGPDKPVLENFVSSEGIKQFVTFHGFRQKNELPKFFVESTALLFQTDFDIWGLVLNEAMSAGLPCIASINAGAVRDLVINGKNSITVNFNNTDDVVKAMNYILDNKAEALAMGKAAADFIAEHATVDISADGFINAIDYTLNKTSR